MSRMSAQDLMDMVDFIKNEDLYSKRLKELKAQEAALDEKLKIANTLDKAEAMAVKMAKELASLERKKVELLTMDEELRKKRDADLEQKWQDIQRRSLELRKLHDEYVSAENRAKEMFEKIKKEQQNVEERVQVADKMERELVVRENKLAQKIARLREVMDNG